MHRLNLKKVIKLKTSRYIGMQAVIVESIDKHNNN